MPNPRITVPYDHVAVVLPRENAHTLNSLALRARRARQKSTSGVPKIVLEPEDIEALGEYILAYGDTCVDPAKRGEEQ